MCEEWAFVVGSCLLDRVVMEVSTKWARHRTFERCTTEKDQQQRTKLEGMGGHFWLEQKRDIITGWFRLNAKNCVPGNSSRRFFELDHEILHTYSGRQYLKLEEGGF